MFRKILVTAAMLVAFGHAYAAVDVNMANEDALCGIKGIGPAKRKPFSTNVPRMVPTRIRRTSASASRA